MTKQSNKIASALLEEEEPGRLKSFKQTTSFFVNIISQICEHMIGEYLLGYDCARHVLNRVGF